MVQNKQASHEFVRVLDAKLVLSVIETGIMSFCGVVVETAMNVAFPALMLEFSVDTATVQWMTTGYLVVLAIVIPTSAYLKATFKTKHLFVVALLLFLSGLLVCAFAPNFALLLLGRIIQGVGTGIALPLMFNIIIDQTPVSHMGMMIGLGTLVTAMAPAVGPSLGGVIIENFGWRAVFFVLVPVLLIAFVMGITSIRQASDLKPQPFDWQGSLLLAVFIVCFIMALSDFAAHLMVNVKFVAMVVAGVFALALFVGRAKRTSHPVINLAVFEEKTYTLAIVQLMLLQLIILALGYLMPNYAQLVVQAGPAASGSVMLPGCLLGAAIAPVSGRILDRFGAKRPVILGNVLVLVAVSLMSYFGFRLTLATLTGFYMIFTIGSNLTMGNTMTYGLESLSSSLKADGNATINTAQQLAGAIGTALVTGVVNASQQMGANLVELSCKGCVVSFYLLVGFAIIMLACTFTLFKKARR